MTRRLRRLRRLRRRGQRGAVAVLSGLMAVVLVGMAAFVVDLGQAYVSKRQLQTASDAAALGAAAVMAKADGTCATLADPLVAASATAQAAARTAADALRADNRPGSSRSGSVGFACSADQRSLEVTYTSTATTASAFSGLWNGGDIAATRSATASVSVSPTGDGLRPYMVCSTYVPSTTLPSAIVKVDFPTTNDPTGSCPHAGGNWFTLDCPHAGSSNNGNPDLATATASGCDPAHPISVVDPQDTSSAASLYTSLRAACPATAAGLAAYDPDCLTANPGNLSSSPVIAAWDAVVALHKPILFPVFCGSPSCNPTGWVQGANGNNTMYPVHKLAAAQVCGYHWGNKDSGSYTSTGPGDLCAGAPSAGSGSNQDNYLLLAFTKVLTTGSTGGSGCGLGLACDGGARRVLLTR